MSGEPASSQYITAKRVVAGTAIFMRKETDVEIL